MSTLSPEKSAEHAAAFSLASKLRAGGTPTEIIGNIQTYEDICQGKVLTLLLRVAPPQSRSALLEQAFAAGMANAATYNIKAGILEGQGGREEALSTLEEGIALYPSDPYLHCLIGLLYMKCGKS